MTNQKPDRRTGRLAGPRQWPPLLLAAAALLTPACSEEEPQAAAPAPVVREAAPQRPSVESLQLDARVQFPADRVPMDPRLAEAVAALASAIASGDDKALARVLDRPMQGVLDDLVSRGEWAEATSGIEVVRVVGLDAGEDGARVGLAVQDSQGAYLLGWTAQDINGRWVFSGLAAQDMRAARAEQLDGAPLTETALAMLASDAPAPARPERMTPEEEAEKQNRQPQRTGRRPLGPGFLLPAPDEPNG